ncbi:MAG: hypothetical protein ACYDAG_12655 [Chloroflexota bacterium]
MIQLAGAVGLDGIDTDGYDIKTLRSPSWLVWHTAGRPDIPGQEAAQGDCYMCGEDMEGVGALRTSNISSKFTDHNVAASRMSAWMCRACRFVQSSESPNPATGEIVNVRALVNIVAEHQWRPLSMAKAANSNWRSTVTDLLIDPPHTPWLITIPPVAHQPHLIFKASVNLSREVLQVQTARGRVRITRDEFARLRDAVERLLLRGWLAFSGKRNAGMSLQDATSGAYLFSYRNFIASGTVPLSDVDIVRRYVNTPALALVATLTSKVTATQRMEGGQLISGREQTPEDILTETQAGQDALTLLDVGAQLASTTHHIDRWAVIRRATAHALALHPKSAYDFYLEYLRDMDADAEPFRTGEQAASLFSIFQRGENTDVLTTLRRSADVAIAALYQRRKRSKSTAAAER